MVFQRTLPPTVEAEEEVDLIMVQVVSNVNGKVVKYLIFGVTLWFARHFYYGDIIGISKIQGMNILVWSYYQVLRKICYFHCVQLLIIPVGVQIIESDCYCIS